MSPYALLDRGQSRKAAAIPAGDGLQSAMSRKTEAPPYDELINFPRAKDKDEIRCVMCGNPPSSTCVIPRQNKDVCKDCDKSTWQHVATGVYFKWCKGCKKFLRLGSFSEKLDAAKCDRCRERGRQSYLLKKGKDGSSSSGGRSRSNSINSMKSDFEDISESLDLAAAAVAIAAVASNRNYRSRSSPVCGGSAFVSSSSGEEEDREASEMCNTTSDSEFYDEASGSYKCPPQTLASCETPSAFNNVSYSTPMAPVVIDDDSADVTKSKLSSVFGMRLKDLTCQNLAARNDDDKRSPDAQPVSASLNGTLYELACIHQRIMTLEEHAERVQQLEERLAKQSNEITELKRTASSLREELELSRQREETSHEEAEKLRSECTCLLQRQSLLEKKEQTLNQKLQEADAWNAISTVMERAQKRPRLVSMGE